MTELIEVATDPTTAFSIVTDELDAWWGRGTRVRVIGTVPRGVDDTAELSMLRMAPQWFPRGRRHGGIAAVTVAGCRR